MSGARRTAFWIALACFALGALIAMTRALLEAYAPARAWTIARDSGWVAATALCGALAVSPLRRLLRSPGPAWLPSLRRSLGITAACAGSIHAGCALALLPGIPESLLSFGWLRAGVSALALLCVLFTTSFDRVIRRLRLQHWGELHWLVYPAAFLVVLHAVLGPAGSTLFELTFTAIVVLLVGLRLL